MVTSSGQIVPVILSGGAGTRLWPLSRELYPKQLLALAGPRTMIQETALRAAGSAFGAPVVVCNEEHRFIIAEQLREIGVTPRAILLEPVGRNTAAAAAAAAGVLDRADTMMLLPSDHVVREEAAFASAVETARRAVSAGRIVTFGIDPESPETGYGYIRRGTPLSDVSGAYSVERFVEKPDLETAKRYLAEGGWAWNSGMYMFGAGAFLDELAKYEPAIAAAVKAALTAARRDLDFVRLDPSEFAKAPSKSIDYAVAERTDKSAVVPAKLGWSDVGAWNALWDIGERDAAGNVVIGDVVACDTTNSYLRSEDRLVSTVGVDNLVIVATKDVVMVAAKDRAQEVKKIVDRLKASGRGEASAQPVVYRPWGTYQTVDLGPRHQVKHIMVKPGARISLQKHAQRAEHWVVVSGTARVTRDEDVLMLRENMSVYIPVGCVHRLENPGTEPLRIVEVQSGSYLGEDDIVRLEDSYGRK
ncbi:MAG: mannose-1-phosphate guanylyltransferase/mannose-6-phosphate isomerase [Alphaproteobacteria bacterium]|nr:mannose-1-phosphate guanylyltransferase/mannose-6-phosphate isomerase [Alphaproteobacteria bacterium]